MVTMGKCKLVHGKMDIWTFNIISVLSDSKYYIDSGDLTN